MLHKYSYTGISTICKTNKSTWHIKSFLHFDVHTKKGKIMTTKWNLRICKIIVHVYTHLYSWSYRSEQFGVKSTYANQHVNVVYFLFFYMNKHQRLLKWKLSDDSSTVVYL